MTVPRWDADQWSKTRRHPGEPGPAPAKGPAPRGRRRTLLFAGLGALVVLAAAVSANQVIDDERVAICHATESEENPYVLLIAKKDGFEHGHHRHHEGDFFVTDLGQGCVGDTPIVPDAGNGTSEEPTEPAPADNGTAPDNSTVPEEPEQPEVPEDPEVPEEPETPTDNGTAAPDANATPEPEPVDVTVRQGAVQDDFDVVLTLRVSNLGAGAAKQVSLDDQLPELRRSWQLRGADSEDCVLDGRSLSCWFGELAPGEERVVELRSFTDRMPCGFSLTNTAFVTALDDVESRNDASSASIAARAC